MVVYNIEQRSEQWYAVRCGRVTGTRFKALVAKESTDTYKDLVTNLACEIISGTVVEASYVSQAMEDGIENEPYAIKAYEEAYGVKVLRAGFITPDEDNPYQEWVGVSPDGLLPAIKDKEGLSGGGLEIKCPQMKTHFEYLLEDRLPPEYRHQVQGSLFVTGLPYWDFVSYVEGMKLFVCRVEPDLELFETYKSRLDKLIEEVEEKIKLYRSYTNDK